jgi:hypothetical protein
VDEEVDRRLHARDGNDVDAEDGAPAGEHGAGLLRALDLVAHRIGRIPGKATPTSASTASAALAWNHRGPASRASRMPASANASPASRTAPGGVIQVIAGMMMMQPTAAPSRSTK